MITITTEHQTMTFEGSLLGFGTSEKTRHTHAGDYITAEEGRCSACRWQEASIYTVDDEDADFVVYTRGVSIIPGETEYSRVTRTDSAHAVQELLTVRKKGTVFMPHPARIALAQAADLDVDLRDVWRNLPAGLL